MPIGDPYSPRNGRRIGSYDPDNTTGHLGRKCSQMSRREVGCCDIRRHLRSRRSRCKGWCRSSPSRSRTCSDQLRSEIEWSWSALTPFYCLFYASVIQWSIKLMNLPDWLWSGKLAHFYHNSWHKEEQKVITVFSTGSSKRLAQVSGGLAHGYSRAFTIMLAFGLP